MRLNRILSVIGSVAALTLAGCRVTTPGRLETGALQWTKHNVTVRGIHDKNPIAENAETVDAGREMFAFYCVVCHGRDGQKTGVPFADNMSPPIPSLASPETQRYSDGQLKWIIDHGLSPSGMPSSKGTLSDEDMWTIVVFLRNLPPAGSLGEPRAYSEEEYAK